MIPNKHVHKHLWDEHWAGNLIKQLLLYLLISPFTSDGTLEDKHGYCAISMAHKIRETCQTVHVLCSSIV